MILFSRKCFRLANEVGGINVATMTATSFEAPRTATPLSMLKLSPLWLVVALLVVGGPCPAAESTAHPPRTTVAILTFEDQTGDPEAAHWRYMIERLLKEDLRNRKRCGEFRPTSATGS